jgi:hypothetical protein
MKHKSFNIFSKGECQMFEKRKAKKEAEEKIKSELQKSLSLELRHLQMCYDANERKVIAENINVLTEAIAKNAEKDKKNPIRDWVIPIATTLIPCMTNLAGLRRITKFEEKDIITGKGFSYLNKPKC